MVMAQKLQKKDVKCVAVNPIVVIIDKTITQKDRIKSLYRHKSNEARTSPVSTNSLKN